MSRTILHLPASVAILASTVCLTSAADLSVEVSWTRLSGTTGLDPAHWGVPSVNYGTGGGDATLWGSDPSISIFRDNDAGVTEFTIFLPNWIDNEPLKIFSGFISQGSYEPPPVVTEVKGQDKGVDVFGSITLTPNDDASSPRYLISGSMSPNPDWETIKIRVGDHPSLDMPITGFHIRTVSIPSPGAVGLLGLSGAFAIMPRRRR
jgi:hypothetical protein